MHSPMRSWCGAILPASQPDTCRASRWRCSGSAANRRVKPRTATDTSTAIARLENIMTKKIGSLLRGIVLAILAASSANATPPATKQTAGVSYQQLADALHTVLEANRTAYAKLIVQRLQNEEKVIEASEHWKDDKALPLPAQMFRLGAEIAQKQNAGLSYSLLSLWPVNKQNAAKTAVEKSGLEAVAAAPDKPFYKEEKLGNQTYFT